MRSALEFGDSLFVTGFFTITHDPRQVMGSKFEKARLEARRVDCESSVASAAGPPPLGSHLQHPLPVGTGAGACGTAAAARPSRGAWRQTYMVPLVC